MRSEGDEVILNFAISFVLVWLFIGGCIWLVLDGMAVARIRNHSNAVFVLGALIAIVAWPKFASTLAMHPRWVFRTLKRNLWGRL